MNNSHAPPPEDRQETGVLSALRVRSSIGLVLTAVLSVMLVISPFVGGGLAFGSMLVHGMAVIISMIMLAVLAMLADTRADSPLAKRIAALERSDETDLREGLTPPGAVTYDVSITSKTS